MTTRPQVEEMAVGWTLILAFFVAVGAVFFRTGLLTAPPEFDELYHLLAARSWVETGKPEILNGEYGRAWLFTAAIAWLFEITGSETLMTGRFVSLALGALLPVALFVWLARVAGLGVAIVAAIFAIFWPRGMLDSQLLRFYSAHALFFSLGAMFFYLVFEPECLSRWLYGVLAVACWGLAFHFQLATIFGVTAAIGWLCLVFIWENAPSKTAMGMWFLGLVALAAGLLGLMWATGYLEKAWAIYRWTPLHNAEIAGYYGFYFNQLEKHYGWLLLATPVLAILALAAQPRLALFALALFVIPFLVHSFGGMKALRYISYATPFLFVIWAIAIVDGLSWIVGLLSRQPEGADLRVQKTAAVVVVMAGIVAVTGFVPRGFELLRGQGVMDRGDWSGLPGLIDDWDAPHLVATSRELHFLTYAADTELDLIVSSSRVSELSPPEEFNLDPRLGVPAMGTEASMEAVLACYRDGLLITDPEWTAEMPWAEAFGEMLTEAGLEWEKGEAGAATAWRWTDPDGTAPVCEGAVAEVDPLEE